MTDALIIIELAITFIRWLLPVVAILSLVLCLRPKLFADLEKKLSTEFGSKKASRKTIAFLEKENLSLQEALQRNNRFIGLLCFILTVVIIIKIY